jgi:hypothetical protein
MEKDDENNRNASKSVELRDAHLCGTGLSRHETDYIFAIRVYAAKVCGDGASWKQQSAGYLMLALSCSVRVGCHEPGPAPTRFGGVSLPPFANRATDGHPANFANAREARLSPPGPLPPIHRRIGQLVGFPIAAAEGVAHLEGVELARLALRLFP